MSDIIVVCTDNVEVVDVRAGSKSPRGGETRQASGPFDHGRTIKNRYFDDFVALGMRIACSETTAPFDTVY
jgi:hypothetical protein